MSRLFVLFYFISDLCALCVLGKIGCFLCAPDVLHAEQLLISYQAVLFQMRCYHIDFLLCHIVFEAEVFLADLYDERTMPPELRRAHQQNDKAVMQAYGFSIRDTTESTCVAALMKMYQQLVQAEK